MQNDTKAREEYDFLSDVTHSNSMGAFPRLARVSEVRLRPEHGFGHGIFARKKGAPYLASVRAPQKRMEEARSGS
jgi:hypothetical protein